jgi:hypothetical protein
MKTCKDFGWTGVECCMGCHYEAEHWADIQPGFELITIKVDGELVKVCCELASFFYPDGSWKESRTGQWAQNN